MAKPHTRKTLRLPLRLQTWIAEMRDDDMYVKGEEKVWLVVVVVKLCNIANCADIFAA